MSDYFACLDLINFKMSSALLALSPLGCAVGAGAVVSLTSAFTGLAVFSTGAGLLAVGTDTCLAPTPAGLKYCPYFSRS